GNPFGNYAVCLPADLRVAKPGLGLAFELRLRQLDAHDGNKALARVLACQVVVAVFEELLLPGVVVQNAGKSRPEAGHVAAAIDRVNRVGEAKDCLMEGAVVLERALDARVAYRLLDVDRPGEEDVLPLVEMAYEALDAARVFLAIELATAADLDPHILRQRIDDGGADAMEPARDFVDLAAELAASVEHRHNGLEGRLAGPGMGIQGDAATIVAHGDAAFGGDVDPDPVAEAGHGFVDAVVDDLDHEVIQAALIGAADVHAGTAQDGLEAFEDLDVAGGVLLFG